MQVQITQLDDAVLLNTMQQIEAEYERRQKLQAERMQAEDAPISVLLSMMPEERLSKLADLVNNERMRRFHFTPRAINTEQPEAPDEPGLIAAAAAHGARRDSSDQATQNEALAKTPAPRDIDRFKKRKIE